MVIKIDNWTWIADHSNLNDLNVNISWNHQSIHNQPHIHRYRLRALPLREFEVGSQILHQGFHLWPAEDDGEASQAPTFFRKWDKKVTDIRKIEAKLWISMD